MKIHKTGYWEGTDGHGVDPRLANAIASFLLREGCKSCIDLGCGTGYYTNVINICGIPCIGVDGNPLTKLLAGEDFYIADLTEYHYFGNFDWVISLEVGEHIPSEFEDAYLSNIEQSANKGVIISWATPGQGGDGHVNCKTNLEVIQKFKTMGFEYQPFSTSKLRQQTSEYPRVGYWFKQTLMVFKRKESDG